MFNRYLTYYRPGMQMVVFLALISMSWFLGAFVLEFLNQSLLGYTSEQMQNLKEIPALLQNRFKLTEMLALVVMLLLPAVLFAYLAFPSPVRYLRMKAPLSFAHLLFGVLLMIAALPFSGLLERWNAGLHISQEVNDMDARYTMLANTMLSGSSAAELLLNILTLSLVPALVEEIFFRACLQNLLLSWMRKTPFTALLITAVIFSAFHGQLSGFAPRLFLGLLLGFGYYFSGSLWVPFAMHALNNLLTVVLVFLFNNGHIKLDVTNLPDVPWYLGLLSALVSLALLGWFYRLRADYQFIEVEQPIQPNSPTSSSDND